MGSPRAIVLDTDPGIDDAMAIAVALASPEIEVLALTTVFGNHELDVTTGNARRILDHLGRDDVPVARGAAGPVAGSAHPPATFVHGHDGLGDCGYPPPSRPAEPGRTAAELIVDLARSRPGEITLVAIGPLTNLALARRIDPQIEDLVAGVVLMGGAVTVPGNVTPAAEANIWNDPTAADEVLGGRWPITLIGLDVTHQVHADRAWLSEVATVPTPAARLVADTAPTYVEFHRATDGVDGIHCHDAAAVVQLLRPDLFATRAMAVRVVTDGFAAGATVGTDRPVPADPSWAGRPTVDVAVGVDAPAVLGFVRERLGRS